MAAQGVHLDQEILSCSICLDPLKDPVTIPCGHSYCRSCITNHWDGEDLRNIHSCPQCRQTFTPRPVLVKSTVLAQVVEQLKKTGAEPAADDHGYAGAEDVVCDACTGRKRKAEKSCLQCVVSYCHTHLQPHYESAAFKKHKLVNPSEELQENVCSRHNEVIKMFCRTDQLCICYLCSVDEHKGHDTVSAAAERAEKQTEMEAGRQKVQQKIKGKQKRVTVLKKKAKAIRRFADEAVEKSQGILTEMIRLMEERSRDVEQQIRSKEETEKRRVKELESTLKQEIKELRRKDADMDKLSHTHDHVQFLRQYPSVSELGDGPDSAYVHIHPRRYFEDTTTAVSKLRDTLQHSLTEEWTNLTQVLLQLGPGTAEELLQHSRDITLDPTTANEDLLLSEDKRRVTFSGPGQNHPHHPHRFSDCHQVLSTQSLTGRCYWEVEWGGWGVAVAVAYQSVSRKGAIDECRFGLNDQSWSLYCVNNFVVFHHNGVQSPVLGPGPCPSRVGVYLDHTAGTLSFYSVSETRTLIHRVQTTFTQPLYAGLRLLMLGTSAHLPQLQGL